MKEKNTRQVFFKFNHEIEGILTEIRHHVYEISLVDSFRPLWF